MLLSTRKLLDRSFSALGFISIAFMALTLVALLAPIFIQGTGAFVFRGTVEHRRFLLERFGRGDKPQIELQVQAANEARRPVYDYIAQYEKEISNLPSSKRGEARKELKGIKDSIATLLGPKPGDPVPVLPRDQYGQTRWDRTLIKVHEVLYQEDYDYSAGKGMGVKRQVPRAELYKATALAPLFPYVEAHLKDMLQPTLTFYSGFLLDEPVDSNMFGGIWPAVLGTFYLTLGAMLFAGPMGIIAAIYFVEYAGDNRLISLLRVCVSTLAGVPSIVFGLFGLAFFINTMHVSSSKSVLAGALTLALLVLPTVIRSAEEAIKSVPRTYREASLALGAGKWRTIISVVVPAALPGILTGVILSMGRAAGETAPIIFTAVVSMGSPLKIWQIFDHPTPALPWNIYNLCTEHQQVDAIRHVQYGMVLTLVLLVLLLNIVAVFLRARIAKKLRG
jgi:phosphate transport system permease protein